MPNWCYGNVVVKGKPEDIKNFCKLFIFSEEEGEKTKPYFARSFIHQGWKDFSNEFLGEDEVEFGVDFAWSCYSCMFEGYPNGKECVTLEWAMKEHNVEVEIETEEDSMGFEEKITTENKELVYDCFDIPEHICQKCGNTQQISKHYNLPDVECYECGEYGKWDEDELVKIVKEKIEKDEKR